MSVASAERREHVLAGPLGPLAVTDHGGAGPTVLLVHGAGGNAATWLPLVERLTASCRVHSVDLPGHGLSRDLAVWSWDEVVGELDLVAHGLDGPVTVVGHSLGGMLAVLLSARSPHLAAAVSVDGWMGHPLRWPWHDEGAREFLEQLAQVASLQPEEHLQAWQRSSTEAGLDWSRVRPAAERSVATGVPRPRPHEVRALYGGLGTLDLGEAARNALCPLHVVVATQAEDVPWYGDADNKAWHSSRVALVGHLREALGEDRVHEMDGPHDLPQTDPVDLAALVLRVLDASGCVA